MSDPSSDRDGPSPDAPEPVPAPAPEPPAPEPSAGTPPSTPPWKRPLLVGGAAAVVVALVATALLALGGGGALSQAEAEEVAGQAMTNLAADLGSQDGGDLRAVEGSLSFDDSDLGAGTVSMEMEWGRQGTARFLLELGTTGGLGIDFRVEGFCGVDRDVLVAGGEAYEVRQDPARDSCMQLATEDAPMQGLPFLALDPDDAPEGMEVTPHGDGSVTARFSDPQGNYTLHVDEDGRATRLDVESPQGTGFFETRYGARRLIEPPQTTGRMPSGVGGSCLLAGGSCTYTASSGDDAPPSEFEVRVYADGATPDDDPGAQPVAAFPLDGGDQASGGFSFSLTEDGDGRFGDGDSFEVTAPGDGYEVVVWDTWADRDVRDVPVPGPLLPWVALVLAGAALAWRRR